MIYIGIDPSLNSTGICVNINNKYNYFVITSKNTKKIKDFKSKYVEYLIYEKFDTNKKVNEYKIVEQNKAHNVYQICTYIENIIKKYKKKDVCTVFMEGVSYGSIGSSALVDLSGLNFAIRNILISNQIEFTIVSPSQNKKFATGLGNAQKDMMIFSWLKIEPHMSEIIKEFKSDDLADAFFLSNYHKSTE